VSGLHIFITALVSGMGLVVSALYLAGRVRGGNDSAERALWARLDAPAAYDRRRRRRTLGMAIMALISVAFFVGVNFVDVETHPRAGLWFWITLLGLLVWLCILALIDLSEIRRLRARLREAARQIRADEKHLRESLHKSEPTGERTP
jgi:hypothetical protein